MGLERKAVWRLAPAHTAHYERRWPEETILDLYSSTPTNGLKIDFYAYNGATRVLLKSVVTNADARPRVRCCKRPT